MEFIYPFFITFTMVFLSELGDKTQLLVLSFSTKNKARSILIGVALGTFFSHGLAILFGSKISSFGNETFNFYSKLFTYISFLLFGIIGFFPKKEVASNSKSSFLDKMLNIKLNCIFIVAISIIIGEFGDKTFLASLGLGLQYPSYKISLVLGSILGMVLSDSIAIFFGRLLGNKLNEKFVTILSNIIFIAFGLIGLINFFIFS